MESNESVNKLSKNIIDRKERCRTFYSADITEKVVGGNSYRRLI